MIRVLGFVYVFVVLFLTEVTSLEALQALTDSTFNQGVSQKEITLVMFMAPWCGHCQKLHPEIQSAAETLADNPSAGICIIDCTGDGKGTCGQFSISGYPTLKIFKRGQLWKEYEGDRDSRSIVSYIKKLARPSPVIIHDEESLERLASVDIAYVGFFSKDVLNSELKDIFLKIADENRGTLRTGLSEDPEMIEKHCPQNGVVFLRMRAMRSKYEPDEIVYDGEPTKEALETWMQEVKHGIVGVRKTENKHEFKTPLVVVYYAVDYAKNPKKTNLWRDRILQVAHKFTKHFNFAVSSKFDFQNDFFQFGYTTFPVTHQPIVLATTAAGKFKMQGEFELGNFEDFLIKLKKGKLIPFVRSEKTPERNDGAVKILTAKTYTDLVVNSGRDSFILFYSPKCTRSKVLLPVWLNVGKAMKEEDVDIFKFDVLENDREPAYELVNMPTLYWVPKTNKSEPIRYKGDHNLSSFVRFIAAQATDELKSIDRAGSRKKIDKTEL